MDVDLISGHLVRGVHECEGLRESLNALLDFRDLLTIRFGVDHVDVVFLVVGDAIEDFL